MGSLGLSLSLSPGNPAMQGGVGAATPKPLLMSSRLNLMGFNGYAGSDGTMTDSNCKIGFYNRFGCRVTKIGVVLSNWRLNGTNEADGYNDINVNFSMRNAGGVVPGASGLVIPPSGPESTVVVPVDVIIENGELAYWQGYVWVAPGGRWPQGYAINTSAPWIERADFNTHLDKSDGSAITSNGGAATTRGFGPVAIIALEWEGTPYGDSYAGGPGDSIEAGTTFGRVDPDGNFGPYGNACHSLGRPYMNMSYTGYRAEFNQPVNLTRRLDLLSKAKPSDAIYGLGFNDMNISSRSAVQTFGYAEPIIEALLDAVAGRVYVATITPKVTLTDGGETLAGQTVPTTGPFSGGAGSERQLYNAMLRGIASDRVVVVEAGDAVESTTAPGKFKTAEPGEPASDRLIAWQTGTVTSYAALTISASGLSLSSASGGILAFGGSIVWKTGVNTGIRSFVQSNGVSTVTLVNGPTGTGTLIAPPSPGDTFETRALGSRTVAADGYHLAAGYVGGVHIQGQGMICKAFIDARGP
jgi:hypothetical protein